MLITFLSLFFVLSFGGLLLLVARKIPALLALPELEEERVSFWQKRTRPAVQKRYSRQEKGELEVKTAVFSSHLSQKEKIDSDADYWQRLQS